MTTEEFNALPSEARRFIESNAGCLGCGNKESKLTKAYELYLKNKKMSAYQIKGGGVNYKQGNETGVLYKINDQDSPLEIRHKIKMARAIHKVNPELFIVFDEKEQDDILKNLPKEEVVDLNKGKEKKKEAKTEEAVLDDTETEDNEL